MPSAVFFYANLHAIFQYGAGAAFGQFARANVFAKRHQQPVDGYPFRLGQPLLQRLHGFFGCGCLHISPTVGDAVYMNIHANGHLARRDAQCQVGAFGPNAFQANQLLRIGGQLAAPIIHRFLGDAHNGTRLLPRKGAAIQQGLELLWGKRRHLLRRAGRAKQPQRNGDGGFIEGADGNNAGYQLFKKSGVSPFVQIEQRSFWKGRYGCFNAAEHFRDIKRRFHPLTLPQGFNNNTMRGGHKSRAVVFYRNILYFALRKKVARSNVVARPFLIQYSSHPFFKARKTTCGEGRTNKKAANGLLF